MHRSRLTTPLLWIALAGSLSGPFARAEGSPAPALTPVQGQQYQTVCARCHARPDTGAPLVGDAAAWRERTAAGFSTLLKHTVDGWRTMPPLGTCGSCNEADLRALVAYVSGVSDPASGSRKPGTPR